MSNKKFRLIIIILSVLVVGLIICVVSLVINRSSGNKDKVSYDSQGIVVNMDNVSDVFDQMEQEPVKPGYFAVNMNNDWHFENAAAISSDAFVSNVTENTNAIYFDVVRSEDESQVLYHSPIIPVGSQLKDIALDEKLEDGKHDCVMIYHLVDDNQVTVSTLRIAITITVGN